MTLYEPGRRVGKPAPRWDTGGNAPLLRFRRCRAFPAADLPPNVRREMVDFVQGELLTENWMRAQSQLDMAATISDRPDHGPMGAYDAWPAVTVDALCRLGYWNVAPISAPDSGCCV